MKLMKRKMNYFSIPAIIRGKRDTTRLVYITSSVTGVKKEQITSKTRERRVVEARQIMFKILREEDQKEFAKIGSYFNKDHATILYGVRNISNLIEVDKEIESKYNEIKQKYLELPETTQTINSK